MTSSKIDMLLKHTNFALQELSELKCNSLYQQDCHVCNTEEALKAIKSELEQMKVSIADDLITVVSQQISEYESIFGVKPTRIYLGKSEFDILETWANQQEHETGYLYSSNCPQLFGIKLSELYLTNHISVG